MPHPRKSGKTGIDIELPVRCQERVNLVGGRLPSLNAGAGWQHERVAHPVRFPTHLKGFMFYPQVERARAMRLSHSGKFEAVTEHDLAQGDFTGHAEVLVVF